MSARIGAEAHRLWRARTALSFFRTLADLPVGTVDLARGAGRLHRREAKLASESEAAGKLTLLLGRRAPLAFAAGFGLRLGWTGRVKLERDLSELADGGVDFTRPRFVSRDDVGGGLDRRPCGPVEPVRAQEESA